MQTKNIVKNKYYAKKFFTHFWLIFIGVIFIFALLLLYGSIKKNLYYKNISKAFSDSCIDINNTIQTDCYDFCYLHLYEFIRPSIFSDFYNQFDTDTDFLNSIKKNLTDTIRYENQFKDIILYRNHDDLVVSVKKSGFRLDTFYSDYDDIKNILNKGDFTAPFFMLINTGTADSESTSLYYVFPKLKNGIRSKIMTGFAACVIDNPGYIFGNPMPDCGSNGVFVAMNETDILYSSNENSYTRDFLAGIIENEQNTPSSADKNFSKNYFYIHSTTEKSSYYPLTYFYYEPMHSIFYFMLPDNDAFSAILYILLFTVIILITAVNIILLRYKPDGIPQHSIVCAENNDGIIDIHVDAVTGQYFIEDRMDDFNNDYVLNERLQANHRIIENIIDYIENNIEEVTLAAAAEHFHITSPHLSRTFKEATGTNFSDFVSEKKLLKAAGLLKSEHSLTIAEISHRMGYNTPAYFSQKFKVRFGVTPAAYRKQSN